jgi:hypothetical protein
MFVIEKTMWEDGNIDYSIAIQDSRYDHNYNTVWGRIKRAASILFGKPIYYSDVYLEGEETFKKLVNDMAALEKWNLGEADTQ